MPLLLTHDPLVKAIYFRLADKNQTDRESVVGSVIQGTWTVVFEDGLWIGNHLKDSKWSAEGLHYTLGQIPPGAD